MPTLAFVQEAYIVKPATQQTLDWNLGHPGELTALPVAATYEPFYNGVDAEGFAAFTRQHGASLQIVGDDFLVSDAARVRDAAAAGAANCVLLKPNQRGTLSETHDAWAAAKQAGYAAIVSARSGETEDTTIADLVVATGVGQIKTGSMSRSERTAKYNRLLRIAEELGPRAVYPGAKAFERGAVR